MPHNDGPLIGQCTLPQFKCIIINNFKINTQVYDCYIVFIKDKLFPISKVENICLNNHENMFVVKIFNSDVTFFKIPMNSMKL